MIQEKSLENLFHELSYYTTAHPDPAFIHQHAVDAFGAQNATTAVKPITITFALVGLYLLMEKNFTGKQVQKAHMKLAKNRKRWPEFILPENRGNITVHDVISLSPGQEMDKMILKWCASVWEAYSESHQKVADLLKFELWKEK
jgi:hypothetical protein